MVDGNKIRKEFEKIYTETCRRIYRIAAAGSRTFADAEDVFQETYLEFLDRLREGAEIQNPENYLITIVRRRLWAHNKVSEPQMIAPMLEFSEEILQEPPDEMDIEETIISDSLYDEVIARLRAKDETVQRIFYLYYRLDMQLSDIAELLDIPLYSVKNKLYRTLKELRKLYGGAEK